MASNNLLTQYAKVIQSELMYYYPTITYPLNPNINLSSIYCFLGKAGPWIDDNNPPAPTQDQKTIKNIFKNIFVLKNIGSDGVTPVIARVDWKSGVTYDYYRDDVNLLETDPITGLPVYNFYVKNSYDQVFKCLWNNNGQPSQLEPFFEPGSYSTNNIYQGADGYKWKFMFSVDLGLKSTFMDDAWIPLPVGVFAIGEEGQTSGTLGSGDIEVINVTNGGYGYDPANSVITITIVGDGSGATATPVVNTISGMITDIVVTNSGANYTFANVIISTANSSIGANATAIAPVSPIGGHASDPTSELGAVHNMFVCSFNGNENGFIPGTVDNNITYYQVGLLINPSDINSAPNPANNNIYQTTTNLQVAPGFGVYQFDETVYQGNPDNPTFTGTVLNFDADTNIVYLINTYGTLTTSASLYSYTSGTTRTLLSYTNSNIVPYTGYIAYYENRSGIERSVDGIEQFKFVLGF